MLRDVHVDHAEVARKRRQMEGILDDLEKLRDSLTGITESMVAEASANTSGGPAPIFGPLLNASDAAVERLQKSLDAIHYRVSADLDILGRMSEEVRENDENAARDIDATDVDFVSPMPKPVITGLTSATPMPKPSLSGTDYRFLSPMRKPDTAGIVYPR